MLICFDYGSLEVQKHTTQVHYVNADFDPWYSCTCLTCIKYHCGLVELVGHDRYTVVANSDV